MQPNVILSFLVYAPRVYSGLDRFNLILAKKMIAKGYTSVFVFADTMADMPAIQTDLESVGAIVELIPSKSKKAQIKAVWKLYNKYRPAIVHTHFVNSLKLLTLVFSRIFKSKHYTTFHSMIAECPYTVYKSKKGILKAWGVRMFFRMLAKETIFTVSQLNYTQFCDYCGYIPTRLHRLYLGVATKRPTHTKEEIRTKLNLAQDTLLLCNISAKESLKCIDIQLKALALLKEMYPNQKLSLVHIGGLRAENKDNQEYEQSLYKLAEELGVVEEVVWLGRRNDVSEIMPAFDIYIHPSRFEGLPTVLMEAAQASLPMVGSKAGGIPEFIHDGENGYLCEVDNPQDLADKISKLIADKELRSQMGSKSREILLKEFNIDTQTDKLVDYYLG